MANQKREKVSLIYIYNNRWSREKLKLEFLIRVLILCHVSRFILLIVQFKYEIGVQFYFIFTMLLFKYLCKCVINIENQKDHINYNHFYLTFFRPMKHTNFGKEVAHGCTHGWKRGLQFLFSFPMEVHFKGLFINYNHFLFMDKNCTDLQLMWIRIVEFF